METIITWFGLYHLHCSMGSDHRSLHIYICFVVLKKPFFQRFHALYLLIPSNCSSFSILISGNPFFYQIGVTGHPMWWPRQKKINTDSLCLWFSLPMQVITIIIAPYFTVRLSHNRSTFGTWGSLILDIIIAPWTSISFSFLFYLIYSSSISSFKGTMGGPFPSYSGGYQLKRHSTSGKPHCLTTYFQSAGTAHFYGRGYGAIIESF